MLNKLKKYKKKKEIKEKLENLDNSLYIQICQYSNRANTKYHKGIIDALTSVRAEIEKILGEV